MSSENWDKFYSRKEVAKYPDNMLVRFVAKYYYDVPNRKDVKFLDVGCGAGSSVWYLAREGFSVAGIDGSKVAMERLRIRLEEDKLEAFLGCGDITQLDFKENYFDCIIDISSLCYIPDDKIKDMMSKLHKVLKPGGRFFSIAPTEDCSKDVFNENGIARFDHYEEIENKFKDFKDVSINSWCYELNRGQWHRIDLWVVEAEK